ncbi:MAG: PilZ domain-containing protein [Gammaproteobacteria bacterium]|nr:PilZ domain-containing protein [Gammaproteobacteria bacterium]
MSKSETPSQADDNRRSFYRLQDRIYIEFTPISNEKANSILAAGKTISPKQDMDSLYIESLNRQMGSLMATVRSETSAVAQYLDVLNKKVDFVAGMLFFERFKNTKGQSKAIRTNTVDISEGGLSFNSKVAYKNDTYFQMKIIIVSARIGIECIACVVSSQAKKRGDLDYFRIGVQFPHLPEEDRRSLTRYIMERQRENIRSLSEIDDWEEA